MKNKLVPFFILLSFFVLTTSCGTKKRIPKGGSTSPAELSQIFGVRVTGNDNIHLYSYTSGWIGTPHRMGGNTKSGVDCSGFVCATYKEVYKKQLNRSTKDIWKNNCKKVGRGSLKEGDLVFFRTTGKGKDPTHVGIYLKNDKFIHTSSSKGVMVSSLSEPYYKRTWMSGGRVK